MYMSEQRFKSLNLHCSRYVQNSLIVHESSEKRECSNMEIFQREIEKIVSKVEGATNAQDDILVWGRSKDELKSRYKKLRNDDTSKIKPT